MMDSPSSAVESAASFKLNPGIVVHWYDFVCPFCYVGQQRNYILHEGGVTVVELPFRAHPEMPKSGVLIGPRVGPMYDMLNRQASEANLPLHWPDRLPDTSLALSCAEWIREQAKDSFAEFQRNVFAAHFARQENIGDQTVLDNYAAEAGMDVAALHTAFYDGTAEAALEKSERYAKSVGVRGTPAWLVQNRLIVGLRSVHEFEAIALSLRSHPSFPEDGL